MFDDTDFLGGSGAPAFKFENPGDTITGFISEPPRKRQQTDINTQQPVFWDPPANTQPKYQWEITLIETQGKDGRPLQDSSDPDDSGERRIFMRSHMLTAGRDAVRQAGATGLEVGAKMRVTFTGYGEAKRGLSPAKLFQVQYKRPENPPTNGNGQAEAQAQSQSQQAAVQDEVPF